MEILYLLWIEYQKTRKTDISSKPRGVWSTEIPVLLLSLKCKKKMPNVTQGSWMFYYFLSLILSLCYQQVSTNPICQEWSGQLYHWVYCSSNCRLAFNYQQFWIYIVDYRKILRAPMILSTSDSVLLFSSRVKSKWHWIIH